MEQQSQQTLDRISTHLDQTSTVPLTKTISGTNPGFAWNSARDLRLHRYHSLPLSNEIIQATFAQLKEDYISSPLNRIFGIDLLKNCKFIPMQQQSGEKSLLGLFLASMSLRESDCLREVADVPADTNPSDPSPFFNRYKVSCHIKEELIAYHQRAGAPFKRAAVADVKVALQKTALECLMNHRFYFVKGIHTRIIFDQTYSPLAQFFTYSSKYIASDFSGGPGPKDPNDPDSCTFKFQITKPGEPIIELAEGTGVSDRAAKIDAFQKATAAFNQMIAIPLTTYYSRLAHLTLCGDPEALKDHHAKCHIEQVSVVHGLDEGFPLLYNGIEVVRLTHKLTPD